MTRNSDGLSDGEIALMDSIKVILEILLTQGVIRAPYLDQAFTALRDSYLHKGMVNAVAVAELLRAFATDPQREAHRQTIQQVLREPPAGSA